MRQLLASLAAMFGTTKATGANAPDEDAWRVGECDDPRLIIRHRVRLPGWVRKERFATVVVITWKLECGDEFPTRPELQRIRRFEHAVRESVEAARVGVMTSVLTGEGEVMWHYYVSSDDDFRRVVAPALAGHPDYPVTIGSTDDHPWAAYAALT